MTVAIGVLASDGVVLAADREETLHGKLDQQKIRIKSFDGKHATYLALIVGAGDAFQIDAFAQRLERAFGKHTAALQRDPVDIIGQHLDDFYTKKILAIAPMFSNDDDRPDFSLLIGLTGHPARLFRTQNKSIVEVDAVDPVAAIGWGQETARETTGPLVKHWGTLKMEDAAFLAAYAVFRAKERERFVGKQTDMFAIRGNVSIRMPPWGPDKMDAILRDFTERAQPELFQALIGRHSPDRCVKEIEQLSQRVAELRSDMGWGPPTQRANQAVLPPTKRDRKGRTPSRA